MLQLFSHKFDIFGILSYNHHSADFSKSFENTEIINTWKLNFEQIILATFFPYTNCMIFCQQIKRYIDNITLEDLVKKEMYVGSK